MGQDTRSQILNNNSFPWNTIGLLIIGRYTCTATLISHNIALTASHCVYGERVEHMKFYNDTKSYSLIHTFITPDNRNIHEDFALIFLDKSYTNHMLLGIFPDNMSEMTTAGYPGDKLYGNLWSDTCLISQSDTITDNLFHHNCVSVTGISGSPVWNDDMTIYGINTGIIKKNKNSYNMGIKINKYVYNTIQNWIIDYKYKFSLPKGNPRWSNIFR